MKEKPWYLKDIKGCVIELNGEVYKILSRSMISVVALKQNENGTWDTKPSHIFGIAHATLLRREND